MTYHMNRLQALPGPVDYFVSVNPGDRVRDDRVILARAFEPPAVHVPDARRRRPPSGGSRATARTWYAGAHLGFGFHEDGCRSGLRGGATPDRRRPSGRWPHEVAPARRHGRAIGARGRSSTPSSTTSTTWRSTSTSSTRSTDALRLVQPEPAQPPRRSATTTTGPSRRRTCARRCSSHLRADGRGPDRLADHAGHEPAGLRLRLQPGELLPVPRCGGRAAGGHRRGPQHAPRAPPLHAPARDGGRRRSGRRWRRRSTSRRSSTWRAATRSTSTTRPSRLRIGINERQGDAPLLATSLVLRRRPLTDRMIAPDAPPPPVHDAPDDRADPLARPAPVAARDPASSGTVRSPDPTIHPEVAR